MYNYYNQNFIKGKIKTEPFAYMRSENNRLLLGGEYLKKIDKFINMGLIQKVDTGRENKYRNTYFGYVPTINNEIGYMYVSGDKFDQYYVNIRRNLSKEAKKVITNLSHAKFNLSTNEFAKIIKNTVYPKYVESKKKKKKKKTLEEYSSEIKWIYERMNSIEKISIAELSDSFTEDKFGGRLHYLVTSVPSSLRKYILLNNEETLEIDAVQSQPSIISRVLKHDYALIENSFSKIVENEDLYVYIQNELGLESREAAKNYYYSMAYDKHSSYLAKKLYYLFDDIEEPIKEIKETKMDSNPNSRKILKEGEPSDYYYYTNFSHLIQQKESSIFRMIWRELSLNGIVFLPIHDSVIVKKSDKEKTMEIMYRILKEEIHESVKLDVK